MKNEALNQVLSDLGLAGLQAQVKFVLDVSGSAKPLYNGSDRYMQKLVERLVPIAMTLDPDQSIPLYFFSSNVFKSREDITMKNLLTILDTGIQNVNWGGTNYAPPIELLTQENRVERSKIPTLVFFITDGQNDDKVRAEQAIMDASNYNMFFQFIGIRVPANKSITYTFLEGLDSMSGRKFDNANFYDAENMVEESDENVFRRLLEEFGQSWIPEVHKAGLIN